jgi:hypothetical protein
VGRTATIRVLVAGKRAPNRKVTLRVGGKKTTKLTNAKGVVTFKIAARGAVKVIAVK